MRRLQISIALGLLAGLRAFLHGALDQKPRDFAQIWFAARALLHGQNPYALIGPGLQFDWRWPLFYPLPAVVAAIPLASLSQVWAGAIFMAISGAVFAWALMAHGYRPVLGFFGAAMVLAAETVQWSPLLAASLVIPFLSVVLVAKPTIGAAIWLARPTWWALVGATVLSAIAFVFEPGWIGDWRSGFDVSRIAVASGIHFAAPVTRPGGAIALLALLRWRRPEARLVAALACVPQTLVLYETVPLFLVPRTLPEVITLIVLSYVAQTGIVVTMGETLGPAASWWIISLLYVPAVAMVLRRPNEGMLPAWLESRVAALPKWMRGVAS